MKYKVGDILYIKKSYRQDISSGQIYFVIYDICPMYSTFNRDIITWYRVRRNDSDLSISYSNRELSEYFLTQSELRALKLKKLYNV